MPYIITDGTYYLTCDNQKGKVEITTEPTKAFKWNVHKKAKHVCSTIPKKLSQYKFQIVGVDKQSTIINLEPSSDELSCHVSDKLKDIKQYIKELNCRKLYLVNEMSRVDREIVDIEHATEFYSLNAAQGYKMYKLLHDTRVRRRKLKEEIEMIGYTLASLNIQSIEQAEKSIAGMQTRKYAPRALDDLFKKQ